MDWRVRSVAQILVLGCLLAALECGTAEQRVVCYYTNWSVYRPGTAKFSPQNINPYLCTHLIYAFGGFTKDNALKPFDKYQDIEKGGYAKFTGLKTYNKNLKTMLAVGGWNEGSSRFSPMVADPERRKEFVRNTVKFLRQNHFDGLDLDWEYPAFRDGGKPRDRDNYASLVQELREAYERESSKTGRPRLLLSMAVPAGIEYINKGYDIPKLNKYLDFINLLSYDYHSSFEPAVNHHSPLYPLEEDNEYNFDTELTVDYTIKHLLESGASADKIVLGIPTYGRSYTLFNEDATDIGSPSDGPGEEGDATREKGYLAYYEICESLLDSDEWEVVSPNPNAMGPYAYKGNQWVGYDDEAIVKLKAQYVTENGLGGIMFWSIDNDDFRGKCHDRPYPLIEAAKEAMLAGSEKTSVKEKSTRPTKTRTDSNFIGRKLGAGRRRTTETPVVATQVNSRKRVNSPRLRSRPNARENSEEEETQVQVNGRNRGQFFGSEEDEDISSDSKVGSNVVRSVEYGGDEETEASRPGNRNRVRNGQGRRRKPENTRRRSTTASSISEPIEAQAESHRLTTPEPPTTPDPGTDFKCEDEGFFSHPRDCKKYFWCLDAGPGGLGIVAHHFTCPAGLVFNKAADSCDYPRNVVCPKVKAEAPTTRAPIRSTTSRPTRIHSTTRRTTTTTTDSNEYSDEFEYYDDEDVVEDDAPVTTTTAKTLLYKTINRNRPTTSTSTAEPATTTQIPKTVTSRTYQSIPSRGSIEHDITSIEESEEDPRVIKELIDLIKKAGGIEELEKQLHLQGKGTEGSVQAGSVTDKTNITPATISRSLYERVLNRKAANGGNSLFRRTTVSPNTATTEIPEKLDPQPSIAQRPKPTFRNGPGQAQFEGLDDIPEVKSLRRERPQYVTLNRQRSSTQSPDETSDEIDEDNTDGTSAEEKLTINPSEVTPTTQKESHGYVDIRRSRTSTTRSSILDDESESDTQNQRRRPVILETETEEEVDDGSENLQASTESVLPRRRHQFPVQEEQSSTTSRYTSIHRVRSTTEAVAETSSEDGSIIVESTTKSTDSPTNIINNDKIDDKVSIPEIINENETTTKEPILYTTTPVIEPLSTTETMTLASADLPVQNFDPSTTLSSTTVNLVEESSTVATLPFVSSTPIQESISDEPDSKGSTTVTQSRPFGFQRRTRPTTTTTTELTPSPETASASSVSSDSGRIKVPSETVRLPTLKELIGYSKTNVAHDYTSTTPITLSIKILSDDNAINPSEITKYASETVTPVYDKQLLPHEVGDTKSTVEEDELNKYTTLETAGINDYKNSAEENNIAHLDNSPTATESSHPATLPIKILKQDKIKPRRRKIKFVNIPVRILESDKPITDVVLEVPEYKLNTVLKSLLRVEIINQNNQTNFNSEQSKDVNTYSQRTRYNANQNNSQDDYLTQEQDSNELLNENANTNAIFAENPFTSTTPRVSTVRGSLSITPMKSHSRAGFYVTKSIDSNILYESSTSQTTLLVTELDNEFTQQFTTTNDAFTNLSTSNDTPSTITTEESASQELSTTTEQSSTHNDKSSTITTEESASQELSSTTEQSSTHNDKSSTITTEESASQELSTTTEQSTTRNDNPSTIAKDTFTTNNEFYTEQQESWSKETWPSMISTSLENLHNILAINDDINSAELITEKTTVTAADTASTEYFSSTDVILDRVKTTTEPAFTESDEKSYTSDYSAENYGSYYSEGLGRTDSQETFESNLNSDISTTTLQSKSNPIGEDLDYYTVTNTATPDLRPTTINQNTDSVTDSSTAGSEATNTIVWTSRTKAIGKDDDYYTATSAATPDLWRTTINQKTDSATETSTSGSEAMKLSTGFNYYTETNGQPDLQKTTVSGFEATITDSTKFLSTETSTPRFDNTVTYTKKTGFNTEVNPYTETVSIESTSDFGRTTVTTGSTSDFKSTTFVTDQPFDNSKNSVLPTATIESAVIITNSANNPDVQTTTVSRLNPETSTLYFTSSSIATGSTASDSITTHLPSTIVTDETETVSSITNDVVTNDSGTHATTESNTESTTESASTVTITTLADHGSATQQTEISDTDSTYFTKINQQVDAQTISSLVTSGSEETLLPSSITYETTSETTTTRKEESVNEVHEIRAQQDFASNKPVVPTEAEISEFSRQGFYRSPTAIPGKKTVRKRIIRKRIYGVRRPHLEPIAKNETASTIVTLSSDSILNTTQKPRQRFIRRRIINHSTGEIIDQRLTQDRTVLRNRTTTSDANPEFVQKVNESPDVRNNVAKNLHRHRAIYRRRPTYNQTNISIEANISSQNNSASNDVQSSSVSSTKPNQRRRIVVQRFRNRGVGLRKSSTVSPRPSPSPSSSPGSESLLVAVSELNSTEITVEDKLQEDKRMTSGQDYTDVTIDNLNSGSEIYGTVSAYEREELPRNENTSEPMKSEDEQADGEINLFKTRPSNQRRPGTLVRQNKPSTSTSVPENEIATTILPSIKPPASIAVRRRFRLGQRPATQASNAEAQSSAATSDGEPLKSGADEDVLKSSDQTSHAQEVEVTVAVEDSSSPIPPVSKGRRPPFRTSVRRRISTTEAPQVTVSTTHPTIVRQRQRPKPFEKISEDSPVSRPRRPAIIDYDYYEDSEVRIVGKPKLSGKISFSSSGSIRCLDQGNFPHPTSCKKFITCARMVNGQVVGTEYTCPKRLSFDPVGGICNWSAGLGCKE